MEISLRETRFDLIVVGAGIIGLAQEVLHDLMGLEYPR